MLFVTLITPLRDACRALRRFLSWGCSSFLCRLLHWLLNWLSRLLSCCFLCCCNLFSCFCRPSSSTIRRFCLAGIARPWSCIGWSDYNFFTRRFIALTTIRTHVLFFPPKGFSFGSKNYISTQQTW